jgi:hypothetical protein
MIKKFCVLVGYTALALVVAYVLAYIIRERLYVCGAIFVPCTIIVPSGRDI